MTFNQNSFFIIAMLFYFLFSFFSLLFFVWIKFVFISDIRDIAHVRNLTEICFVQLTTVINNVFATCGWKFERNFRFSSFMITDKLIQRMPFKMLIFLLDNYAKWFVERIDSMLQWHTYYYYNSMHNFINNGIIKANSSCFEWRKLYLLLECIRSLCIYSEYLVSEKDYSKKKKYLSEIKYCNWTRHSNQYDLKRRSQFASLNLYFLRGNHMIL